MDEPRLLGGRYRIGDVLGRGGMAAVRIGVDERLGRTVAVKILRADLEAAPTFRSRFRREARAAAALDHPAIVTVYDTGEDVVDGMTVPFIVMEYVDGRTLAELQQDEARIPADRAMSIMADVLGALDYSHRAGIVHRDVKPANVMLTPTGAVKVMDFGIARVATETAGTMTSASTVIGTAHYLSPEQARGEAADARSDVYSAGCTLYALLANRPPFLGDSAVSVAYQHVREEPHPPSAFAEDVPPAAEAITMKALAKRPEDRYESAAQMRDDIVRALAGEPIIAAAVAGAAYTGGTGAGADATDAAVTSDIPMGGGDPNASADTRSRRRFLLPATIAVVAVVLMGVAAFAFGDLFNTGDGNTGRGPGTDRTAPPATETESDRSPRETADDSATEDDADAEPADDDGWEVPAESPSEEPDDEPTETPSQTPTPTETPSETSTPTQTPSQTPSDTPTETPSDPSSPPEESPTDPPTEEETSEPPTTPPTSDSDTEG